MLDLSMDGSEADNNKSSSRLDMNLPNLLFILGII